METFLYYFCMGSLARFLADFQADFRAVFILLNWDPAFPLPCGSSSAPTRATSRASGRSAPLLRSGRHPSILCHGISKKCTFRRLHSVCFIRVKVIFRCQYILKIFTNFDINDLYMNPNCSEYYLHL